MDSTPGAPPPKTAFSPRRVALLVIPLAIVCALTIKVTADRIVDRAKRDSEQTVLESFDLTSPTPRLLGSQFSDADADLVADAPENPTQQIVPEKLVFSYVAGPDAGEELPLWQEFCKTLEKLTGKPVEAVTYEQTEAQMAALAKGELHVTAFNTGAVPAAVASCGFVPAVTFGGEDGAFGITMQIIVPAESPLKSVADLKGRNETIAFTTRDSNSGCKAALALLRDHDLLPLRDYRWKFSGGHEESIRGVAEGIYPVAAVASDLLQRAIASGTVSKDKLRTIHESERFPPATLGYIYYLPPELADHIRAAFAEFEWTGSGLEKQYSVSGATKFVPVSYKQDFALIRRIDDTFHKPTTAADK